MTVNSQRDSCVAVSQLSLSHRRRSSDLEQQGGMRVTKSMQSTVFDAKLFQNWPQSILHHFVRVPTGRSFDLGDFPVGVSRFLLYLRSEPWLILEISISGSEPVVSGSGL